MKSTNGINVVTKEMGSNTTDVTLDSSATDGGLSITEQAISNRAASNLQTGYATAAQITSLESAVQDSEFTADSEILVGTGSGTFQKESGATALTSLGAAASGANADITSMTGLNDGGIPAAKVAGGAGKDMIEIQVFL